jgi:hypothetical protein
MMVFGEVDDGSYRVSSLIIAISDGRGLIEYFCTHFKPLCDLTLDLPAEKPIILIIGTGVNPVPASSVCLP